MMPDGLFRAAHSHNPGHLDIAKEKASSPELAGAVFADIYRAAKEKEAFSAAQCCGHLNRALILEREAAEKYGWQA